MKRLGIAIASAFIGSVPWLIAALFLIIRQIISGNDDEQKAWLLFMWVWYLFYLAKFWVPVFIVLTGILVLRVEFFARFIIGLVSWPVVSILIGKVATNPLSENYSDPPDVTITVFALCAAAFSCAFVIAYLFERGSKSAHA